MLNKKAFITHPVFAIVIGFIVGLIVMGVFTYMGYTSGFVCPAKP